MGCLWEKLEKYMDSLGSVDINAIECIVYKDHKPIFHKCCGYSDPAKTVPSAPTDYYWLFSASKVITCLAALRLLEEGKIALDDPVAKYVPEFATMQVKDKEGNLTPAKTAITLHHLFTMTAGMNYNENHPALQEAIHAPGADTLSIVRAMAKMPLAFEPGTHYQYSFCHDVLGAVIEVVTGKRLSEYMDEIFFAPLGLSNIGFHPTPAQLALFADMYKGISGTHSAVLMECSNVYLFSDRYDGGGAGLFSAADDYAAIITAIANGGTAPNGYRLLKPETIALAQKNHLHDVALNDFATNRLHGYGWGLCGRVHIDPVISFSRSGVGEFGWDSAANSYSAIDPDNRVAIFFCTHVRSYQYGYHTVHGALRDIIYECLFDE